MVLLVIAEIKCHNEERMNAYLEFLKPLLIPATGSASTGCTHRLTTGFDGHMDETVSVEVGTNTVHLAAHWESQEKWDNYLAFRQASGVVDNTGDFGVLTIRFFDSRTSYFKVKKAVL